MKLLKLWRSYWFTPAPVLPLAVTRIILVGVQLYLLMFKPAYNIENLFHIAGLPDFLYRPVAILRLLTLPMGWDFRPSFGILLSVYGLTLATGITSFIGFRTKVSLVLFGLGNVFLQSYSYSFGDFHHPETVMMVALFALALSPSGGVLSVDDMRRRMPPGSGGGTTVSAAIDERRSAFARWPLLLIQWFLAIIYFDAALNKLYLTGLDWMNGHTLQYYLFTSSLRRGNELGLWFAHQHELALLLSWLTIIFEATFFLVLIFRGLTKVYIPLGIALHLGMCVTGVACFRQYLAAYCVFVPWTRLYREFVRPAITRRRTELESPT